ncbi:hypothetical protein MLD38_014208 [Melastoma candidum]|uniref:Uncharacterized protein n=1 Tax=Melastoma candidum TaxID=119954 RepID=A0ACB9RKG6_9MYRT|nr:hypothetical protein MLD38_014208 [Melastoma candidum]
MSIRFKFRSSLNFDSFDIGEWDSITVADLKSKIRRRGNVNVSSGDCDLVLSDAPLDYVSNSLVGRSSGVVFEDFIV